jgi:Protein of unknown function DUF262
MKTLNYQFRTKSLLDLVNLLKADSLILSPHFQRKLVWRDLHKVDFIKTILLGFPFPEIFIARGGIDVDKMSSVSCIVDGQQRMNAILEFVQNKFSVNGRNFSDFSTSEKETFLKYEIAIVELDIDKDDEKVIEIFKRLNRTFYSLSQIEKLSTEYASSYFMLIAKLVCGDLYETLEDEENGRLFEIEYKISYDTEDSNPNITKEFIDWANKSNVRQYNKFILEKDIFTSHEISRQVPLIYTLNIASTLMNGIYSRNELVTDNLELYKDDFKEKDDLINRLNSTADIILNLNLENSKFWFSKSNSFSLLVALDTKRSEMDSVDKARLEGTLNDFAKNIPPDYALAAKEAVNNKKERLLRDKHILELLNGLIPPK